MAITPFHKPAENPLIQTYVPFPFEEYYAAAKGMQDKWDAAELSLDSKKSQAEKDANTKRLYQDEKGYQAAHNEMLKSFDELNKNGYNPTNPEYVNKANTILNNFVNNSNVPLYTRAYEIYPEFEKTRQKVTSETNNNPAQTFDLEAIDKVWQSSGGSSDLDYALRSGYMKEYVARSIPNADALIKNGYLEFDGSNLRRVKNDDGSLIYDESTGSQIKPIVANFDYLPTSIEGVAGISRPKYENPYVKAIQPYVSTMEQFRNSWEGLSSDEKYKRGGHDYSLSADRLAEQMFIGKKEIIDDDGKKHYVWNVTNEGAVIQRLKEAGVYDQMLRDAQYKNILHPEKQLMDDYLHNAYAGIKGYESYDKGNTNDLTSFGSSSLSNKESNKTELYYPDAKLTTPGSEVLQTYFDAYKKAGDVLDVSLGFGAMTNVVGTLNNIDPSGSVVKELQQYIKSSGISVSNTGKLNTSPEYLDNKAKEFLQNKQKEFSKTDPVKSELYKNAEREINKRSVDINTSKAVFDDAYTEVKRLLDLNPTESSNRRVKYASQYFKDVVGMSSDIDNMNEITAMLSSVNSGNKLYAETKDSFDKMLKDGVIKNSDGKYVLDRDVVYKNADDDYIKQAMLGSNWAAKTLDWFANWMPGTGMLRGTNPYSEMQYSLSHPSEGSTYGQGVLQVSYGPQNEGTVLGTHLNNIKIALVNDLNTSDLTIVNKGSSLKESSDWKNAINLAAQKNTNKKLSDNDITVFFTRDAEGRPRYRVMVNIGDSKKPKEFFVEDNNENNQKAAMNVIATAYNALKNKDGSIDNNYARTANTYLETLGSYAYGDYFNQRVFNSMSDGQIKTTPTGEWAVKKQNGQFFVLHDFKDGNGPKLVGTSNGIKSFGNAIDVLGLIGSYNVDEYNNVDLLDKPQSSNFKF